MNRRDLARVAWPLLLLGMLTGGCADRTYLTPTYGRAYSEAFRRQAVNRVPPPGASTGNGAGAGRSDATQGLDSQEAAAVARSYRRSLAGQEGASENPAQSAVIMNSGSPQLIPYMPPPSVPGGQ